MNRRSLAGLVVLNVALLLVLGVLCLTPQRAGAQLGGARSDYIMVAGRATGQEAGILWIVETTSGKFVAVGYNKATRQLAAIDGHDIADDLRGGQR